ncbi:heat-inducible transcription repressor HrcA [Limosilactobacillus coleohominis 101-4-CHN]|uniref:Heat-inducible transcription repressor HrcA n=1 Tax=Limosilactobacillus coleohominis 101-4-CHN TaxID=575594 RepID=C7XTU1_9LACO|nr:heat-inducible transcriptional repressor HrcA [Limosilactobacillus coleohominis]EEU30702.1 heat-inducible transcription repressor HrcA [Limosilactobacillus coleohominis 101-4-CHN]
MLTQRQEAILKAIVRQYTNTGQPVGSKVLVDQLPMKVSSATIRNEMAYLEHEGMVTKEHSSSGRIPSKKGYRYYVDHLLDPDSVSDNDLVVIQNSLGTNFAKLDEIISHSADILSQLTSLTAFTIKPEQKDARLSGFRLVPLGNQKVMGILVTDTGDVENQTFRIPRDMDTDALEAVVRMINDQLTGKTLVEVVRRLQTDLPIQVHHYLESPEGFLDIFDNIISQAERERFFVGGQLNLMGIAGKQSPSEMKALYELLDTNDRISRIIDSDSEGSGITIKIGNEIANSDVLNNYSLITAKYNVDQYGEGMIAVLGPTAMPYSRTIGIVDAFRKELAKRLLNYYHHYYGS